MQCAQTDRTQSQVTAGRCERLPYRYGLIGWHVELVAELADVGDTDGEHSRVADLDLAGREVGETLVGHVIGADALEQLT